MERPESLETALDEALDALVAGDMQTARRVQARYGNAPELAGLMEAAGRIRSALAATPSPQVQARHLGLIREAAGRLGEGARPAPRPPRFVPGFIRDAAGRLAEGARSASRRPRFVPGFVLRPALVLGLLLVLAAPGALALSARALPGDPLYSTKLAIEHVRLAMARDPAKEVDLHVEFAQRRMEELSEISNHGLPQQAALVPVLSSLQDHQQEAAKGVVSLKEEGRSVGVLEERLAVTLQQNTARLVEIRSDTGCGSDGTDARCVVISTAVNGAEQTLRGVDEGPAAGPLPDDQAGGGGRAAPPDQAGGSDATQAPPGQDGGRQPGSQAGPPASGSEGGSQGGSQPGEAGPGGGQNQSGGATGPQASPTPDQGPPRSAQPGGRGRPSPPPVKAPGEVPPASGPPLQAQIDIKPFDDTNTIDVVNRRDLPVVVHSSQDFDAATLVLSSICFGDDPTDPANSDCGVGLSRLVDVDRDGRKDLLLMFQMGRTGIDAGDTEACLTGRTTDGRTVKGCDSLSVFTVSPSSTPGVGSTPASPQTGATEPRPRRLAGP